MPDRAVRLKIDHQVTKYVREHFVIYADEPSGRQVWHWVRREAGKPLASRDHRFDVCQTGDPLIQRLERIAVSMQEEEALTLPDIAGRNREAFDVDKVTKKFYERFKAEHSAFLKLIKGFPPPVKVNGKLEPHPDLQWYTSLMLNRLMFVYFIQKKGFLDGDTDYLRTRLALVQQARGKDKFQSFYRYFLLRLFHDGLGKSAEERKLDPAMEKLLGKVPYLNGGFFEGHKLETDYPAIEIPDQAFETLFDFFEYADKANGVRWNWHLDERAMRADNEINPDVVGYIFEKYINQKQMGAYYTKEDITEYISKNTIIPYLFDAARKKCAIAFKPDSALWCLLRDDPDRYIYPALGHGVTCDYDRINHQDHKRRSAPLPLPAEIEAGVTDVSKRDGWNNPAPETYAMPTETWREVIARRQRCLEVRDKLRKGEVHEINDLITLNLDIWQFARDAIVNAEGPELLRAFWHAIAGRIPEKSNEKIEPGITILDPTCGSGAFLFAALRILETLYSDCLERMERFVEDLAGKPHHPKQFSDFKSVLAGIGDHRGERYFILKSIIINNLFGVDIMPEAVEICKLRLFLKLVAQVETGDQIEPLPDIDFNIRPGNTLVGFSSAEEVRNAFTQERTGANVQGTLLLGSAASDYQRFEEDMEIVDRAFQQFRAQQTVHGGRVTAKAKKDLREDAKLAISRGAAYHALALQLTGAGVVHPITSDAVLLQTNNGPAELVPSAAVLPYPGPDKWATVPGLKVPEFPPDQPRFLKLELVTPDLMRLFAGTWTIPKAVRKGTALRLQYQIDANQIMRLRLNVATAPEEDFWEWEIENPLVNIEYTESKREEIEQIEENIRTRQVPSTQVPDSIVRVADLTAALGQRERALDLMKKALAAKHGNDANLLNKMGILCGEMRDHDKEAKFYAESAKSDRWGTPLFNLALSQNRRGLLKEAEANIEEAMARHREAPYLVLRALIAEGQHDPMKREECLKEAMSVFGPMTAMSDWELGWYLTAAARLDDQAKVKKAKEEQQRRSKRKDAPASEGQLPDRGAE